MLKKDNFNIICLKLTEEIKKYEAKKPYILIAVDGRSASGKTTLAAYLKENLPCEVIHMDDFFQPIEKRKEDWLNTPGGNIDYDRLINEVMIPLQTGKECQIRPFDCRSQSFGTAAVLKKERIILVEGAYCCHPKLWHYFDLHIFTDVEPDVQKQRIRSRNGEDGLVRFETRWIPLEEAYFSVYKIREKCELHF